jgi:hypothetical protein
MALQSSGQISLSNIQSEFGGSNPISLSEYYGKGNAPASGEIQLAADFYGTSSFNAQWSGNSIYYSNWGVYTSGSLFKVYANGANGAWKAAYTNGTFQSGDSVATNAGDMSIIGGNGGSYLRAGWSWAGVSYVSGYSCSFTVGSGFSGTAENSRKGINSSGGLMRTRNINRYGGYIGLS